MKCRDACTGAALHSGPQYATDSLSEAIPPPAPTVDNVTHDGMQLVVGKSNRATRGSCLTSPWRHRAHRSIRRVGAFTHDRHGRAGQGTSSNGQQ